MRGSRVFSSKEHRVWGTTKEHGVLGATKEHRGPLSPKEHRVVGGRGGHAALRILKRVHLRMLKIGNRKDVGGGGLGPHTTCQNRYSLQIVLELRL